MQNHTQRKGYARKSNIPRAVQEALNRGVMPTANLVEWLSVDQGILLKTWLQKAGASEIECAITEGNPRFAQGSVLQKAQSIGEALKGVFKNKQYRPLRASMLVHESDMVRCWAAYAIAAECKELDRAIETMRPLACDKHFAVREVAWLSLRERVVEAVPEALQSLEPYTLDEDENMRRFVSEITRPRGVWCKHIAELKQNPELGLGVLEPLRSDPSRYVQNSVANWLNDASKTCQDWVLALVKRWEQTESGEATRYIIKRATRSCKF